MNRKFHFCILFLLLISFDIYTKLYAEERILISADNQVIEINRKGKVLDIIKFPDQDGVYDAWRLPDGGIVFIYRLGLKLLDAKKNVIMEHKAIVSDKGAEINSVEVLEGGKKFALMESGINKIIIIDRTDKVLDSITLPVVPNTLHFRYRMIRKDASEDVFWVAQKGQKTLLKVDMHTSEILKKIPIQPYTKPTDLVHKCYAIIKANDGSIYTSTSDGGQIIHIGANDSLISCWTIEELGLKCRYFNGLQLLKNGNIMVACSDFHIKTLEAGNDIMVEITPSGKIVWRLTRSQIIDQIEGRVDPKTGIEELRIANIHVYDNNNLKDCLNVKR